MRRRYAVAPLGVILIVGATEHAQQPAAAAPEVGGPAYLDPANWHSVHPTETDNIVYATVPHITNPSAEASPNPGLTIDAQEIAKLAGTISYSVLCGIHARVKRIYV